jgi:uncharacterized protein with HEPN domain
VPPRHWKLRIDDILVAIERIQRYTDGMDLSSFSRDDRTVDAVVRNITVIGEAAAAVPEDVRRKYPELPWEEMRGIWNVIVHEYFGVSLPILWQTVTADLPPLIPLLKQILSSEEHT